MWPYNTDPSASDPTSLLAPAQVGALASDPGTAYAPPTAPLTAGDASVAPVGAGPPGSGVTPAKLATLGKQLQGPATDFLAPQQIQAAPQHSQSQQIAAALARAYGLSA